jgi:hypothetical protein
MPLDSEPVVIVSNDTYIGPRLVDDLRDYCPAEHLDDFDRFAASTAKERQAAITMLEGSGYLDHTNFRTAGNDDGAKKQATFAGTPNSQAARSVDLLDLSGKQVEILQIRVSLSVRGAGGPPVRSSTSRRARR